MTDLTAFGAPAAKGQAKSLLSVDERTRKRNAAEARFRLLADNSTDVIIRSGVPGGIGGSMTRSKLMPSGWRTP